MTETLHPFEKAGLGKAPFRFVGMFEKTYQACPGAPIQPGGCCDYCSNGIRYLYAVRSADSREFVVGSDCIRKVAAKGSKLLTDAERAFKAEQKKRKSARLAERMIAARAKLEAFPTLLTDTVHPAMAGKTGRDYAEWMLAHAGDAGKARACKAIELTEGSK